MDWTKIRKMWGHDDVLRGVGGGRGRKGGGQHGRLVKLMGRQVDEYVRNEREEEEEMSVVYL